MRYQRILLLGFLALLWIQPLPVNAWEVDETTQVTSVKDGDTFDIPGDAVRLADINAPEYTTEPGYSIAKYALADMVGGKTVYLDTDQKSGRDQYDRLIAVVYVKVNSTHYMNVNKALVLRQVATVYDYANNEFDPSKWALYVKYADASSLVGPAGPQGIQGPPGEPAPTNLLYLSLGISVISLIVAIVAILISKHMHTH